MENVDWLRLVALLMVAVLVVPAALARNRGRVLPHAAAWLAVIVLLMLAYQTFGPF